MTREPIIRTISNPTDPDDPVRKLFMTPREKPAWVPIWLACECGAQWDDWQPCMVPIGTWVAHVESYHCPSCGKSGRNILLRREPLAQPCLPGVFK